MLLIKIGLSMMFGLLRDAVCRIFHLGSKKNLGVVGLLLNMGKGNSRVITHVRLPARVLLVEMPIQHYF